MTSGDLSRCLSSDCKEKTKANSARRLSGKACEVSYVAVARRSIGVCQGTRQQAVSDRRHLSWSALPPFSDIQPIRRVLDVQLFHARRLLFCRRVHWRLRVRFMRRASQNAGRRQVSQRRKIQHAIRDEAVVAVANNEGAPRRVRTR
jgi:hypothetical protein